MLELSVHQCTPRRTGDRASIGRLQERSWEISARPECQSTLHVTPDSIAKYLWSGDAKFGTLPHSISRTECERADNVTDAIRSSIFHTLIISFFILPASCATAGGPNTLNIGNVTLQKNGDGIRKKSFLSLYEAALYLPSKSEDAGQIISANAPMAMRLQIQSGFVSQQKLLAALDDGFSKATGGNIQTIEAEVRKFRTFFSDAIRKEDVYVLAYLPESGLTVYKNGQMKGTIAGIQFKQAVFGIWLSTNAVDGSLKNDLLGR
jgi:hypothetical protein